MSIYTDDDGTIHVSVTDFVRQTSHYTKLHRRTLRRCLYLAIGYGAAGST